MSHTKTCHIIVNSLTPVLLVDFTLFVLTHLHNAGKTKTDSQTLSKFVGVPSGKIWSTYRRTDTDQWRRRL